MGFTSIINPSFFVILLQFSKDLSLCISVKKHVLQIEGEM